MFFLSNMVSKNLRKFTKSYLSSSVSLSLGSQILDRPEFGNIGQQGAQGLELGSRFLPPIALIGVSGETIRQARRLGKSNRRR